MRVGPVSPSRAESTALGPRSSDWLEVLFVRGWRLDPAHLKRAKAAFWLMALRYAGGLR